jgi:uncharacterized membrane protein YdjX (TVP38/TMEM64 family)
MEGVRRKQHCKETHIDGLFAYYNLKVYIEQMRAGLRRWMPWILLSTLLLIVILTPFFLFEETMNAWVERLTGPHAQLGMVTIAVVSLLALDVVLPVPSSVVSTAAGAALGFLPGLLASTAGMTLGSILGYACGRKWGLPLTRRMVRQRDLEHVSNRFQKGAGWALAVMRPVPVLAEASSLFAGVAGVPIPQYLLITTLANIGISALYCAAGAKALHSSSFLLAFAASIGLPGLAMAISRFFRKRQSA